MSTRAYGVVNKNGNRTDKGSGGYKRLCHFPNGTEKKKNDEAFVQLKAKLSSTPILSFPQFNMELMLIVMQAWRGQYQFSLKRMTDVQM